LFSKHGMFHFRFVEQCPLQVCPNHPFSVIRRWCSTRSTRSTRSRLPLCQSFYGEDHLVSALSRLSVLRRLFVTLKIPTKVGSTLW
jgi:hypothetical protein